MFLRRTIGKSSAELLDLCGHMNGFIGQSLTLLDGINSKRYFEKRIEISASCQFLKFLTVSDRIRDNQMKTCIQRTNELADLLTDQVNI